MTPILRTQVPRGRKLVRMTCTWVYKKKRDGPQKARLCVQGCSQVHGVDYDQAWSGTLRASSLRALSSALAAKEKLHRRRWDFVAAFLQGGGTARQRGRVLLDSLRLYTQRASTCL